MLHETIFHYLAKPLFAPLQHSCSIITILNVPTHSFQHLASLSLEVQARTNLVRNSRVLLASQLGRVQRQPQASLNARPECLRVTKAEDTGRVNLCLDEGGIIEVRLGSDLEVDTRVGRSSLGVVGGTGTGFDVGVDAVVVRGRVGGEVAEALEGDGVLGGLVAGCEVVARDLAALSSGIGGEGRRSVSKRWLRKVDAALRSTHLDIVGSLGTSKESVLTNDGVGGEGGALEEVKVLAGVDTRLLVGRGEEGVPSERSTGRQIMVSFSSH